MQLTIRMRGDTVTKVRSGTFRKARNTSHFSTATETNANTWKTRAAEHFSTRNTTTTAHDKLTRFHTHPRHCINGYFDTNNGNQNNPATTSVYFSVFEHISSTNINSSLHVKGTTTTAAVEISETRRTACRAADHLAVTGPAHANDWLVQTALFDMFWRRILIHKRARTNARIGWRSQHAAFHSARLNDPCGYGTKLSGHRLCVHFAHL